MTPADAGGMAALLRPALSEVEVLEPFQTCLQDHSPKAPHEHD